MSAENALTDYVISDKRRIAIYQDLAQKGRSLKGIARKLRMPDEMVRRELDDLRSKGLVEKNNGMYSLTEAGRGILEKVHVYSAPEVGMEAPRNLRRPSRMVGQDNRRDKGKQGT